MELHLPAAVDRVLERMEQAGEQAYLVGGCVRDLLLGRPVHDYDIAVSTPPDRTAELFAAFPLVETGRKHGTIGVVTDLGVLELTTFRAEGDYADHRHPGRVRFLPEIEGDLSRRDFTVNAIAADRRGNIVDPFGGREDLSRRLLRCVGEPRRRFEEDSLRILRCARFAAVLGFGIEPATLAAGVELAGSVGAVSRERVTAEVLGLFAGEYFPRAAGGCLPLLAGVWPEVSILGPGSATLLSRPVSGEPEALADARLLALAALLWETLPRWQAAERLLVPLRLPRVRRALLLEAADRLELPAAVDRIEVKRRAARFSDGAAARCFLAAELLGEDRTGEQALHRQVIKQGLCRSAAELKVRGRDLLELGIPAGPDVGRLLDRLLDEVLEERLANRREDLLAQAQVWRDEDGRHDP